jgi:hypothetical protein
MDSKKSMAFNYRKLIAFSILFLAFIVPSEMTFSQTVKREEILCYKDVIKDPLTFYGNPGDSFTLYDNTSWRVATGGQYEYIPMRYKDVVICPTIGKLMIGNKALSISKN